LRLIWKETKVSEPKKDWRIEMKEIVEQTVKTQMESLKPKELPTLAPSAKDTHAPHTLNDLIDCPDCYPTIRKKVLEKEILSRKDKEMECLDCGTRVDESEENCPTCGGKDAKHR